jgi:peroxiredoxin
MPAENLRDPKTMKSEAIVQILCTCTLFPASLAPRPVPDPQKVLLDAAKACKKLVSIRYTVKSIVGEAKVTATFVQKTAAVPDSGFATGKYLVSGSIERGNGEKERFRIAYDGSALRLATEDGKIRVLPKPTGYEVGQQLPQELAFVGFPMMGDFFDKVAKDNAGITFKGQRKIGDWTCDVLEIKRKIRHPSLGERITSSEWAFDQASHLPIERRLSVGTATVTAMTVNPVVDDSVFILGGTEVRANPLGAATDKLLPIGQEAPDFSLKSPDGKAIRLRGLRGKVVLLDFWGTWCQPCARSMPTLQRLYDKYRGRGFTVLGVSLGEKEGDPAGFMRRMRLDYPILLKGDRLASRYRVSLLPSMYIIDRSGKIVYRQAGLNRDDEARLTAILEGLVRS